MGKQYLLINFARALLQNEVSERYIGRAKISWPEIFNVSILLEDWVNVSIGRH